MGLDIRIPLGLLFLTTGGILFLFGLFTRGSTIYGRSLGIDVNLYWGAVMLLFGAVMFIVGRRQRWQNDPITPRPWEREKRRIPR